MSESFSEMMQRRSREGQEVLSLIGQTLNDYFSYELRFLNMPTEIRLNHDNYQKFSEGACCWKSDGPEYWGYYFGAKVTCDYSDDAEPVLLLGPDVRYGHFPRTDESKKKFRAYETERRIQEMKANGVVWLQPDAEDRVRELLNEQ